MDSALANSEIPPRSSAKAESRSMASSAATALGRTTPSTAGLPALSDRSNHPEVDEATLQAAQDGERAAVEAFIRVYQRRVFSFLSRAAGRGAHVDDLAQEVFLRVLRALPTFRLGEARVSSWIFQIAVRLVIDESRKRRIILIETPDELHGPAPDAAGQLDTRRQLDLIERLASQLPEDQRVVLVLAEFEGLSQAEIAAVTGAPVATIKTRLHRARASLRSGLANAGYVRGGKER